MKMKEAYSEAPAFPTAQYADGVRPSGFDNGMTLRDYFAAAFLANKWCAGTSPELTAIRAYETADAMMKAREE